MATNRKATEALPAVLDRPHSASMSIATITRVCVVLVTFMLLSLPAASAQQTLTQSVTEAQHHLLQLAVPDSMDTDVPPAVRDGIVAFKKELATQTDAIVLRLHPTLTSAAARQQLVNALPSSEVGKIPDDQWRKWMESDSKAPIRGLYGGELTISVKRPSSSLMLVQETFNIACGTDNVLLIYSSAGGIWKRILLWQSKPYTSVGEAFGDTYETLLLRPQLHGHPLLLIVHGTPWCTSTMSKFGMDVFELEASSVLLWHGEHDYRRSDLEPALTLRATGDGFEVRTSVSTTGERVNRQGVLDAVVSRKGVMRYTVTLDGIHRVEPIAVTAHDSVEEWLDMPQTEAAEFADEPASSLTWTMFREFTDRNKPYDPSTPFPGVGDVRSCKDDATHFQANVTSASLDSGRPGPAYFVQLRQVTNGYRIHAVTLKKDPACGGHDLMAP